MKRSLCLAALLLVTASCGGCRQAFFSKEGWITGTPPAGDSVVVLAAGDIARCDGSGDEQTAAMLDTLRGVVLALGDNAYYSGTEAEYRDCYDPTWGRHRARTRPAPGNHEYGTPGAAGYFAYFGELAGPPGRGWYSFDLGAWHVVSLNSNVAMSPGSEQERWLREDLAAHPSRCTLAFWHHPRFSSGPHGAQHRVAPLWQALYEAGADVVLQGHDHGYERFSRMASDGRLDPARGIRSFVAGGGGAELYPYVRAARGSQSRYNRGWSVLRLTLRADSYEWEVLTPDRTQPLEHGGEACH
jgi:acid phosphatase type 7